MEGTCFDTNVESNWVNKDGVDVSGWDSGTHQFTFDPAVGTLNVQGGFIGLAKAATTEEVLQPADQVTYKVVDLIEGTNADTLILETQLEAADGYWQFTLVSYHEGTTPVVVNECETEPTDCNGTDLEDQTPTELYNTFDGTDVADLVPTSSAVTLTAGVDDPADATAAKVGEYVRGTVDAYSDLKFQLDYDAQLDNFTTVSVDVYFPSSNDYSGGLLDQVDIFIADGSCDSQFWTSWELYQNTDEKNKDEWVTITFDLGEALNRTDLDLIGLKIGGENHNVDGTFYIRNFSFQ